ncbi:unnamed protein product [Urochloa humidicola]
MMHHYYGSLLSAARLPSPVSKVEEGTAEPVVATDGEDCTPTTLYPEPVPEGEHSACNGVAGEEGGDRSCEEAPAECSICLERCCGTDGGLTQLNCRHVFHSACLERWLWSRGDCAYCRAAGLRGS